MAEQILTTDDIRLIDEGLELAKQLRLELQRAKQAGLDFTDIEQQLNDAEVKLRNLRRVYGVRRR